MSAATVTPSSGTLMLLNSKNNTYNVDDSTSSVFQPHWIRSCHKIFLHHPYCATNAIKLPIRFYSALRTVLVFIFAALYSIVLEILRNK